MLRPFLLFFVLAQAACSFTKDLEQHHAELLAAVGPDVPLTEKRDALGYSTVRMMHQAVDRLNPKKGVKYVEAYAKTNGALLDTLAAQIVREQKDMTPGEQLAFGLSAARDRTPRTPSTSSRASSGSTNKSAPCSGSPATSKDAVLGKAADELGGLLGETGSTCGQDPLHTHRERKPEGDAR